MHPGRPGMATLLLPSAPAGPAGLPGADPGHRPAPPAVRPALTAWSVPVVLVDPSELADPADEARYGASVALPAGAGRVRRRPGRPRPGRCRELRDTEDGARGGVAARAGRPGRDAGAGAGGRDAAGGARRAGGPPGLAVLTGDDRPGSGGAGRRRAGGAGRRGRARDRLARDAEPVHRCRRAGAGSPTPAGRAASRPGWPRSTDRGRPVRGRHRGCAAGRALGRAWDAVGTEPAGPARAVFRLVETRPVDDPADPDPSLPDTVWRLEFLLRSGVRPQPDGARRAGVAAPDGEPLDRGARRRCCSPSSAGPAWCTRSWPRRCATARPERAGARPRRRLPVPVRGGGAAGPGRLRGAAAGLVGARRPGSGCRCRPPARRGRGAHRRRAEPRAARPTSTGGWPSASEVLDRGRRSTSWSRPRPRWCGCAGSGSRSTPSGCAGAWSSWPRRRPGSATAGGAARDCCRRATDVRADRRCRSCRARSTAGSATCSPARPSAR